ncbi:Mucin-19 [Liparis tanakae]|uniref:Mucin-19 n=1 Tax=Liparis tanakae TaxID=230148 RepID=A0A4Z2H7Y3_9TELE|nr:Mucin-19 [Liparis tanakae]
MWGGRREGGWPPTALVLTALVLSALVLSALDLSALDLSALVLSALVLSALVLSALDLSALVLSALVLSALVLSALVLSALDLSALVLSALVLSALVSSALVLTALVLSALVLTALVLSALVLSALVSSALVLSALVSSALVLSALVSSALVSSALVLTALVLSALDLSALDLSALVSSALVLSALVLSALVLSALVLSALVLSALVLSALVSSALVLSALVSSALVLSALVSSALVLSALVSSALVLSALVFSALVSSGLDLSALVSSALVLSALVFSALVSSALVLSALVLSALVLSALALGALVLSSLFLSALVLGALALSSLVLGALNGVVRQGRAAFCSFLCNVSPRVGTSPLFLCQRTQSVQKSRLPTRLLFSKASGDSSLCSGSTRGVEEAGFIKAENAVVQSALLGFQKHLDVYSSGLRLMIDESSRDASRKVGFVTAKAQVQEQLLRYWLKVDEEEEEDERHPYRRNPLTVLLLGLAYEDAAGETSHVIWTRKQPGLVELTHDPSRGRNTKKEGRRNGGKRLLHVRLVGSRYILSRIPAQDDALKVQNRSLFTFYTEGQIIVTAGVTLRSFPTVSFLTVSPDELGKVHLAPVEPGGAQIGPLGPNSFRRHGGEAAAHVRRTMCTANTATNAQRRTETLRALTRGTGPARRTPGSTSTEGGGGDQ